MIRPVGNLVKVSQVPVGKVHKTSLKDELKLIVNDEIALREAEKPSEPIELPTHPEVSTPDNKPIQSKSELTKEDVVGMIQAQHPDVDALVAQIMQKLPPMGGGDSWTVKDMPGYKKSRHGYVFGVLNKQAGFYDPDVLLADFALDACGDTVYTRLIDTEGDFKYIGEAAVGSTESSGVWRIKRVEFLAGDDIEIRWADGTSDFTKIWNDRATYTYL